MSRDAAPTQASRWEWMTAALGVALLGLLWAPWYSAPTGYYGGHPAGWTAYKPGAVFSALNVSSWDGSTVTSVVLVVFGVAAVVQALFLRTVRSSGVALAWNVTVNWAAVVAVLWILVRLLWPPAHLAVAWAGWTSLGIAAAMLVTGWLGMRDERDDRAPAPEAPLRPIPPPAA